jgi:TolB-like protein/lipoprotein NlpI
MVHHFLSELRRRNVIQALTAYVVGCWLIIQVFNEVAPMFAVPAWVSSLLGVVTLAGFPVAAYVSWFFDFSGGSLSRVPAATGEMERPLSALHWLGLVMIAIAATAAGTYIFEQVSDRLRKEEEGIVVADVDESVAVLPFEDLSPEQNQAYLATGIAEELASLLGRTEGVETASTAASFRMAERGGDPVRIGRSLGVGSVLTGSVAASGNRLRVRVELTSVEDASTIWRDSFTRTMTDVFALEDDIARSITNLLLDRYVDADELSTQSRTASSDAYVFYLRGRAELRHRTAETVKSARKLFEQSIALDPEYAPAHVGIAETLWRLAEGGENYGNLDPAVASSIARQSIERALTLDSTLPEAFANLGRVEALMQNHDRAIEHYDKAISLNPSLVDVHIFKQVALNQLHDYDAAMRSLERAAELDPTAPTILHNLGYEYSRRGNFAAARIQFEKLIELYPDNPMGYRGLGDAASRQGDLALSLTQWRRAMELSPETPLYQDAYRGVLFGLRMLPEYRPLAEAAGEHVNVLLLEEDFPAVHREMEFAMAADPDDPWLVFEAAWYRYLAGDNGEAARLMLKADAAFSDDDRFAMPMCSPAVELALAYRQRGDAARAQDYIDRCSQQLANARDSVFVDSLLDHLAARLAVLRGDEETAVREMRAAMEHGWLEWWTERDPVLAPLKGNAGMARVFADIDGEIDRQRAIASMALAADG